ncbi:dynamin family protein [Arthrospira platensis]|jgi:energy-coupling factor transporter ATP-binding protein EcfA2|uniref:Dynamin N-terminal domain-containing protein n=1 Tax=Limnospira platensis NIES-46 TaxID=1236695 RepID=A0A5M3T6V1_LIMPL|nr:dynamin family protein [Arthrospira platensis]AMW26885.1 hypothetical protein AP285_01605 [Arthrospira platensis YZ]MBD2670225.1 dynamin family protein [Arthrospira platensis FACHB-439]MBD2710860.1 dynamin family protein [Arthrospira platensis FACHB-835]MDF2211730.1 dynamin family protein [Arthrospira platensis NCB002]QQW29634.1 dynamin family protein [Arthrospira sp. PCC 9108]BAI88221.1 hypothetical protein NIES39_A03830 [Arthrospira platensis NIES-39]
MNKSEEIQGIIAQRQPLAEKLADIETGLSSLCGLIQGCEQERDRQLEYWSGDTATEAKLRNLDFAKFEEIASASLGSLHRLQGRFSRKTLNIGVIGRTGHGKSTLLQSLTGLKNDVIPAMPGKTCTAARSTICHQPGNLTTAEIQFHDLESFLTEVIIPYYEKLRLTPVPRSFKEFADSAIPSLPRGEDETDSNIYKRLKEDYHSNGKKYKEYLGRGSLTIQDESQISDYVASKYNQDGQLINHECLAVKHVKISCPFPLDEIGAIALVDVPGLGDFRLADESLVIEALAQEVDFILFIRKPSKDRANFEQSDTQLYDLANKALNDLPSRSIFVLNADHNGENLESCRSLKRDIDSETVKMPVLDCVIADCYSQEEGNNKVLQAVLDNLRSNVTQLDRNYTQQKIADLQASLKELKQQLQLAQAALPNIDNEKKDDRYYALFKSLYKQMKREIEALLRQLEENRPEIDKNLQAAIERVIKECKSENIMPTLTEIQERRDEEKSYDIAYKQYLNELRASLSSRFLDIDKGLAETIERTKTEVANVLVEKCDLGGIAPGRGSDFIKEVASQIPLEYTELKKGFDILSGFNLSYRGLIQHRIRSKLDRLTPDKTASLNIKGANDQMILEIILEQLKELYQETIYECEKALTGFLSEPSQASFAIVEEFADRVFRAKDVENDWYSFLMRKRDKIWREFENLQKQIDAIQEWSRLLESVSGQINDLEASLNNL